VSRVLRPAGPAACAAAAELLCESLGEKAFTAEGLEAKVAEGALLMLLFEEGLLRGAGLCEVLGEDRAWFAPFGEAGRLAMGEGRVGLLTGMAVSPGHRAKGRGAALAGPLLRHLVEQGCARIVAVSWLSGGPNPSGPLLERLSFVPVVEAPGVFLEDSRRYGLVCPTCGGDCMCAGRLYVRVQAA